MVELIKFSSAIATGALCLLMVVVACTPKEAIRVSPLVLQNSERIAFHVRYDCPNDHSRREVLWFLWSEDAPPLLHHYASYQNEVSR